MDITSMKMAIKTNSAEAHNIVREDNCILCVPSHPLLRTRNIEFLRKKKDAAEVSTPNIKTTYLSQSGLPPPPRDLVGEQAHAESRVKIC